MSSLARALALPLFEAWGGQAADMRPLACDLQLTRLGLVAQEGEVVAACVTGAILALRQGPARAAAELGQAAITLLDRQRRRVPLRVSSETAQAAATDGDGATADAVLARGAAELTRDPTAAVADDPMAAGFLAYEQAQRLMTIGDLDGAEREFGQVAEIAAAAGDEISAATARGRIADILESRGDLDGA